jgi:hypothetical protein
MGTNLFGSLCISSTVAHTLNKLHGCMLGNLIRFLFSHHTPSNPLISNISAYSFPNVMLSPKKCGSAISRAGAGCKFNALWCTSQSECYALTHNLVSPCHLFPACKMHFPLLPPSPLFPPPQLSIPCTILPFTLLVCTPICFVI